MKFPRLPPGSAIPTSEPRRYKTSDGYVLLRWPDANCEVLEHRVVGGRVTEAPEVHHINLNRADNRPENLVLARDSADHHRHHRSVDYAAIAEMYRSGMRSPEISERTGHNVGNIYRILVDQGITPTNWKVTPELEQDLLDILAAGCLPICWCRKHGLSRATATKAQRRLGLPPQPVGRPGPRHVCPW